MLRPTAGEWRLRSARRPAGGRRLSSVIEPAAVELRALLEPTAGE